MAVKPDNLEPTPQSVDKQTFRMRPVEVADADAVAGWYQQIEDVSIFDRQIPLPINHADVVELLKTLVAGQEQNRCRWFVTEDKDGIAVGIAGLENISMQHGNAVLPLFLAEPWRRTGLGIRMACMMIDLAFKQLRLHRISTIYRADNAASAALLVRLGFTEEGSLRESWFNDGRYYDVISVGVLEKEWQLTRPRLRAELNPAVTLELGPRPSTTWCWPAPD